MLIETYPDLTSLWYDTTMRVIREPALWDDTRPPRLFSFPNMLTAESHKLEGDLAWVGLTRSRWTRFLNRYVDSESIKEWIARASQADGLTSLLWRTKVKDDHTGGECMVAIAYRPEHSLLTVYSREAELPMRGLLDAAFINRVAEGLGRGNLKIVWLMGGLFVSLLHALPFLVHFNLLEETMQLDNKSGKYLKYMTNHLVKHSDELKYGPAKRMLKRWRAMSPGGTGMVPVPISELPLYIEPKKRSGRNGRNSNS